MEQKIYTEADYRALQDVPVEPFLNDLRLLCRSAFGPDWSGRSPSSEAMDKLCSYGFLPEVFLALYETIGGEDWFSRQGFLPADQMELEQRRYREQTAENLIFLRTGHDEYAFSRFTNDPTAKPFHGVLHYNPLTSYSSLKSWNRWCIWGSRSENQTLSTVLLRLVGEVLSRELPNCVWLQTPLRKEGKLSRYETFAKRFHCSVLESAAPYGWEFSCSAEQGILLRYVDFERKSVTAYSRDPGALEKLEAVCPTVWVRRDGTKILNPEKFIQSPEPLTFAEKLEEVSGILLGKRTMRLPPEEIEKAEKRLGVIFPDALREFYLHFGKGGKLFTHECFNDIFIPKQLEIEDGKIVLAEENQGVWRMYLDSETSRHYLDWDEERTDCWGLSLEDALLYLLAMNAVGFLAHGGEAYLDDTPENRALMGHFFHFLSEGKMAVFTNPERGLIGCRYSDSQLFIKARQYKALAQLEEDSDIYTGEL